jgi:hypothetical protein
LTTCSYSFAIVGRKQEKEKKSNRTFHHLLSRKEKKLLLYLEKRLIDTAPKLSALKYYSPTVKHGKTFVYNFCAL